MRFVVVGACEEGVFLGTRQWAFASALFDETPMEKFCVLSC
jgi:hypothetical protein